MSQSDLADLKSSNVDYPTLTLSSKVDFNKGVVEAERYGHRSKHLLASGHSRLQV